MLEERREDIINSEDYAIDITTGDGGGGGGGGYTPPRITYYCFVNVKRSDNMMPVAGATVKAYSSPFDTEYIGLSSVTNASGQCIFEYNSTKTLYFKASKDGYTFTGNFVGITPRSYNDAKVAPGQIVLNPVSVADYYYTVRVEDQSGNGEPYAEIDLFNDLTMKTHYSGGEIEKGNWTEGSKPSPDDIFIELKDIFFTIMGNSANSLSIDSFYADDLGMNHSEITRVMNYIEKKYGILFENPSDEIPLDPNDPSMENDEPSNNVQRVSIYDNIGDKADYFIITFPCMRDIVAYIYEYGSFPNNIKYITDTNGYLSIKISDSSVQPKPIYAYGVSNDYTWTLRQGAVQSSTNSETASLTLIISTGTGIPDTYYYNIQLIDPLTHNPVKDASVKFIKDGVLLATVLTDDSGKVSYSCTYSTLTVNITKDGYDEINLSSSDSDEDTDMAGSLENGEYVVFDFDQSNPIQVIKKYNMDSDSEDETEPANGIIVSIGYYDSQKNYVICGKYTTKGDGYIDGISASYFNSKGNTYYAIVMNYVPEDSSMNYALRKRLVLGGVTIFLPAPRTSQDEEEYVQFYDVSANAIKKNVNKGNDELDDKQMTDKVSYAGGDDYRIRILDPDSITTYDIFQSKPVMMEDNNKSVIGSIDIGLKYDVNKLRLKVINRYSGFYNPIFKDVLFYKNFFYEDNEYPFSNVSFDYDYSDKYGKFGVINNMWFHKANDDKTISILNTSEPYYPLTGQYALDHRDYNVFESNWDMEHYTKQLDLDHSRPCANIGSQKNGLCMFGSKYLNVPERIEIYGLTLGDDENWAGEWNDDWITSPDACPGEVMYKEINDNSVDYYFFFTKRIHRFFYNKLKNEFEKYMNVNNGSYGKPGVEDDIREYVTKNVLKLYKLERVRVFVKRTKKGLHNSKIENDYTTYLEYDKTCGDPNIVDYFRKKGYVHYFKQHGFVEVNNVSLSKLNRDDFDRRLTYNLRNGAKEEFAFSFILTKI